MSGVGPNVTEGLIVEASKSLNTVDTICEHFVTTGIKPDSIHHTKKKFPTRLENCCEAAL